MNPLQLSPLTLQFLFLGLLWLMVLLLALRFILPRWLRRSASVPGPAAAAEPGRRELLVEAPPTGDVPARSERVIIGSREVVIGRASAASIRVEDEFTSSRHALIRQEAGGLTIEDLGSTNGTFLNDRPVRELTPLKSGDLIRIGKTTIRVL